MTQYPVNLHLNGLGRHSTNENQSSFSGIQFFGKTAKSLFTKLCFCGSHIALVQK